MATELGTPYSALLVSILAEYQNRERITEADARELYDRWFDR